MLQLLGLDTVCVTQSRATKLWRKLMLTHHTDKRGHLTGDAAKAAAENAALYNHAHDVLEEKDRRIACLHDYAAALVPQVPEPEPQPQRPSKLRKFWARVTRKNRQPDAYEF